MVLDATPSMAGAPITQAKEAAELFTDRLLGSSPEGNVLIGVTPFRGCFRPSPINEADCINTNTQISGLSYTKASIQSKIDNITASSGSNTSATNVCTGLAKAWDIMQGTVSGLPNHDDDVRFPDNRQYIILLSDGDNAYWGNVTYQNDGSSQSSHWVGTLPPYSPNGTKVDDTEYPCMPYLSCDGVWGGENPDSDRPCEDDSLNTSKAGELSDSDGSSPQTCNDTATPRERQMDVRTLQLAKAIKAQGVEIFVVAFAGGVPDCHLDSTKKYNDDDPADCNTVVESPAGPVGNTDNDNNSSNPANLRLLKCIASSSPDTNDHYFYAASANELKDKFGAIANQIAHRLIE
jgi:hypothetical protein